VKTNFRRNAAMLHALVAAEASDIGGTKLRRQYLPSASLSLTAHTLPEG
jgi:hypothetical protein